LLEQAGRASSQPSQQFFVFLILADLLKVDFDDLEPSNAKSNAPAS